MPQFLEQLKQGFKRAISWNKYRSEITTPKNLSLDYMIDPTIRKINWFALSFKNNTNDYTRDSSVKYYMLIVNFNVGSNQQ